MVPSAATACARGGVTPPIQARYPQVSVALGVRVIVGVHVIVRVLVEVAVLVGNSVRVLVGVFDIK